MLAFHSKEWERVATALMAMPRSEWDTICSECFPDLPSYAVSPCLVIATINNFSTQQADEYKTTYWINRDCKITVYHRSERDG